MVHRPPPWCSTLLVIPIGTPSLALAAGHPSAQSAGGFSLDYASRHGPCGLLHAVSTWGENAGSGMMR